MDCVSSSKFDVLVNGSPSIFLRDLEDLGRDVLYLHYLFFLVVESRLIGKAKIDRNIYRLSIKSPRFILSHTFSMWMMFSCLEVV